MADLDSLVLQFPAKTGFLRVCRLNASALAAELDFDLESLDDLRLAVDEAVTWLVDDDLGGMVELRLSFDDASLVIEGVRNADDLPPREVEDLVDAIMGATVDDHQFSGREGEPRRFTLRKTPGAPR